MQTVLANTLISKAVFGLATVGVVGALASTMGAYAHTGTISNTGPNSKNHISFSDSSTGYVNTSNSVTVTNTSNQTSTTGSATSSGNTTGGSATSGSASNTNSSTTTVNISNQ